ncbi:single-stranded DNA-binding protein [Lacticaseibacillus paracasei]|uniref:single-stranded DNA-binding protein n=1 Tax=Lacticaseibacillus paracasei TaxID=1597 RepID=UPI0018A5D090|nr:single-stranded DNA-binding protein [Lacticaseibacillus paracasei]QOP46937.1 single-stranded DNA-binding protein [Lacticaseibacillus paracasei]
MNNVNLIGRIATDVKAGNGVISTLLAVKRIYKSKDGQDTDFIQLSIFGHQADNFEKMVSKGDKIGIDGSIKTSKFAHKNGEVHYGWSVTVNHFYLLSSKPHNGDSAKLSDATLNSLSTKLNGLVKDGDLPF